MASSIYLGEGTQKVFKNTGGDVVWTLTSLANGAGRISAVLDLGAAPRPFEFGWGLLTKFATATAGTAIRLYVVQLETNATTYQDGGGTLGTSDAAVATNENLLLYGAKQIGPTVVQHATAANFWSGRFICYSRYLQMALWNASGVALTATASDHEFHLNPVYRQGQ